MNAPGRGASRHALQRIEVLLNMAREDIAGKDAKTDEALQRIEDAYATCDQISWGFGDGLKALIDAARQDANGRVSARTVVIDIDGALAEVPNVRSRL